MGELNNTLVIYLCVAFCFVLFCTKWDGRLRK